MSMRGFMGRMFIAQSSRIISIYILVFLRLCVHLLMKRQSIFLRVKLICSILMGIILMKQ
ncbi:hypothetical protein HA46_16450 [Pantoea septica]|uniref:Uncharacterized protein n=1 Tax=Pantoea septica TaxID=472695 RepID=A0ABX3UNV4_9GAMM|nr:hypothetical protein HA46_16450 [Pantoea septica]